MFEKNQDRILQQYNDLMLLTKISNDMRIDDMAYDWSAAVAI
jgi:hypothetical protein